MGNAESRQVPLECTDICLYKSEIEDGGFSWSLYGENITPKFYDINEDIENTQREWHLEFEGSVDYPDILVDSKTQFSLVEQKCVFQTQTGEYWALRFPTPESFSQFSQQFNGYLFENTFQTPLNEEAVKKELGYLGESFGEEENEESRKHWVEDMDIDESPTDEPPASHTKDRIAADKRESDLKALIMGGGERSYIVGGQGISVMKNTSHGLEDTELELSFESLSLAGTPGSTARRRSSLGANSTPSTNMSSCSKGILMDYESKMNLLTPGSGSIYSTDLNTGKLLNEFSFKKDGMDLSVVDIANDTKAAQMGSNSTFLSLGEKSIDRWDTRVKQGLVQTMASPVTLDFEGGRSYATNPKFTCVATSGNGYRAVGSKDGKIRLYNDKVEQIAKTSIPSLGAPIDHIDVTYDGRWVLATTKSFLIVLKTIYNEGSKELCGFTSRLGAKAPKPRLLMLTPEDAVYTKHAPLEKARFSWITDNNRKERYIVASCGNYTVQWNFRAVKIAKPDVVTNGLTTVQKYALIPKPEHIIDTTFMHDTFSSHGSLVVLTKQRVYNVEEDDEDDEEDATPRRNLNF